MINHEAGALSKVCGLIVVISNDNPMDDVLRVLESARVEIERLRAEVKHLNEVLDGYVEAQR